ncbi:MAG: aldehyde dehydrogenase family protein [Akkermansiaceae bacterium]|nr:aldehyde dehydrogenase family protein [Akkermansiaceae bacterium]
MQEWVHDELQDALLQRMRTVRVGDGFEEATQMGPCINSARTALAQVLCPCQLSVA